MVIVVVRVQGQTREHAILARSLGVGQIIIAVNKLDAVGWDPARYADIVSQVTAFLKASNFKDSSIFAVPVSGLVGENILTAKEPALLKWYKGPSLIELVDRLPLPERTAAIDKPFRLTVTDVFNRKSGGVAVCGKVISGCVMPRDAIAVLPINATATVRTVELTTAQAGGELSTESVSIARAGDNVELSLKEKDLSDMSLLQVGQFLCEAERPIPLVTRFNAQIVTLNYKVPIVAGTLRHTRTAIAPDRI